MIGLIVHGAESIDNGESVRLLNDLVSTNFDEVIAILAGTTGIKALIDSGLHGEFQYMHHTKVSDAALEIDSLCDAMVIHNDSKTIRGSHRFISIVSQRISVVSCPVLYLDNFHACRLNGKDHELFHRLLEKFSVPLIEIPETIDTKVREVHGALKGEKIWINGNVIGTVNSELPKIWKDDDGYLQFEGIEIRNHGLEHVPDFNPMNAQIRTGQTRRTSATAKSIELEKQNKVVIIDHNAEIGLRRAHNSSYAVSIGDDTTKNASSLLYRFSVPIIGIIDGDEDGICQEDIKFPGSIIFQVESGTDDIIGKTVFDQLFRGKNEIINPPSLMQMASSIEHLIGNRLISKTIECFHN